MPAPIAQGDSLRRNSRRARPREVTSRECIAPKRYARRDREGRLREFRRSGRLGLPLQRGDIQRAAAGTRAPPAESPHPVDDPTKLDDCELWSALAMTSIDTEGIRAREEMWDFGRRGIGLAAVICVLIFLTVPAIYLFEAVPAPKRPRNRPMEPLPFGSARRSLLRTPEYDLKPAVEHT